MAQHHETRRQTAETTTGATNVEEHFQQLFERYYQPIAGFFSRRGFSPEECRDLTQETFLRVYNGMESYRREAGVKTWLFTIATNLYRNEIRARRTDKRDAEEVSLEAALERGRPIFARPEGAASGARHGPLDDLLEAERRRLLRRALDSLPPRMRRCVLLWLDRELKYREIAAILQVTEATVKVQLFQARQRLKEALGEHFTEFDF